MNEWIITLTLTKYYTTYVIVIGETINTHLGRGFLFRKRHSRNVTLNHVENKGLYGTVNQNP